MSGSPTRAKIAIGDVLGGAEPGLRVQACLLYRVLDEDEEFNRAARLHAQSQDEDEEDEEPSLSDYWEWWELVGPNRHDYWVEVDHGSWRTSVYEPLPATDVIDPTGLQVGQHVTLTGTMAGRQAVVTERRLGRVSQVTGQPTYPATLDKPVTYVTVRTRGGDRVSLTFRSCPGRPLRAYRRQVLSPRKQKRRFGRVLFSNTFFNIIDIVFESVARVIKILLWFIR